MKALLIGFFVFGLMQVFVQQTGADAIRNSWVNESFSLNSNEFYYYVPKTGQ
ncbi:MAG: hypothetical protein VW397_00815 [Candidatus Margulisiibacteriota bacterium]